MACNRAADAGSAEGACSGDEEVGRSGRRLHLGCIMLTEGYLLPPNLIYRQELQTTLLASA